MSELAFNLNGDPFELPAGAAGWRVRRMKNKGAPEVAYGRSGQPLVLPLEADLDDLRAEVGTPGRYRLDPVDESNKPIQNAPVGYVFVHELAPAPIGMTHGGGLPAPSDNVVIEAMRMNAEIARTVVDRFPQMMEASAALLRAADGAGLPARPPMALDRDGTGEDDDDGDDGPPASGFDLNALVAQLVPLVIASLGSGKLRMPNLGEMLDWRKASPDARASALAHEPKDRLGPGDEPASLAGLPAIDPAAMVHLAAVQAQLTPEERGLARELAAELLPSELRAWFDELSKLSVADAAQKIRKVISGVGKPGGAS
ncbi:MAG: hypothetical protein WKG01_11420 [Kofleriaceae bacterium]